MPYSRILCRTTKFVSYLYSAKFVSNLYHTYNTNRSHSIFVAKEQNCVVCKQAFKGYLHIVSLSVVRQNFIVCVNWPLRTQSNDSHLLPGGHSLSRTQCSTMQRRRMQVYWTVWPDWTNFWQFLSLCNFMKITQTPKFKVNFYWKSYCIKFNKIWFGAIFWSILIKSIWSTWV
jgi:hypothetical protein